MAERSTVKKNRRTAMHRSERGIHMITILDRPVTLFAGKALIEEPEKLSAQELQARLAEKGVHYEGKMPLESGEGTMARRIIEAHSTNQGDGLLHIKFDALTSHDITYVAALQTAIACGLKEFPVPYVLTNCHNSLCAVGGTRTTTCSASRPCRSSAAFLCRAIWPSCTSTCAKPWQSPAA